MDNRSRLWTPDEDKLALSELPLEDVARRLGRSVTGVRLRRTKLQDPEGFRARRAASRRKHRRANPVQRNDERVKYYDQSKGKDRNSRQPWTQQDDRLITDPDRPNDVELAVRLGRTIRAIQQRRTRLGGGK